MTNTHKIDYTYYYIVKNIRYLKSILIKDSTDINQTKIRKQIAQLNIELKKHLN